MDFFNQYLDSISKEGNSPNIVGHILTLEQCNMALEALDNRTDKNYIKESRLIEAIISHSPDYIKADPQDRYEYTQLQ